MDRRTQLTLQFPNLLLLDLDLTLRLQLDNQSNGNNFAAFQAEAD